MKNHTNLNNSWNFSSHLTENTVRVHYKDGTYNVVKKQMRPMYVLGIIQYT